MNEASAKHWLARRQSAWKRLEELTRRRSKLSFDDAEEFIRLYQLAQGDLALAREELSDTPLVGQLQALVMRANAEISRPAYSLRDDMLWLVSNTVPAHVYALRFKILGLLVYFICGAAAGALLVLHFPALARLFLSEKMIRSVQNGHLWTEQIMSVLPGSVVSFNIMTNNIIVVLTSFTLGLFYGVGTLYIVGINGLLLGGAFAFTFQHGMADRLLAFILPHGFVEISVILVTASCGFAMGESLVRRGQLSWRESLRQSAGRGFAVCLFCLPFLVGAGSIEGYVSPADGVPLAVRLLVGLAYEAVFLTCLSGRLFRRPASGT